MPQLKKFLLNLLQEPVSGKPFVINGSVLSANSKDFDIVEGVPVILYKDNLISSEDQLHKNMDTKFDYIEHYQRDADTYDYFQPYECEATNDEFRRIHQAIAKYVSSTSQIILDVGCGSAWVAKKYSTDSKVVSVDISIKNTSEALRRYSNKNHAAVVADVFNLPFKPESFDTIIASEIIEHLANPALFIQNLLLLLKPDGKLIITTPYNEKIEYQLCVHCNKPTPKHAHLHTFNLENIKLIIPKDKHYQTLVFGNKYLGRLRTHILLGWMPFDLWRIFDKITNLIFNKPIRFLICITK